MMDHIYDIIVRKLFQRSLDKIEEYHIFRHDGINSLNRVIENNCVDSCENVLPKEKYNTNKKLIQLWIEKSIKYL